MWLAYWSWGCLTHFQQFSFLLKRRQIIQPPSETFSLQFQNHGLRQLDFVFAVPLQEKYSIFAVMVCVFGVDGFRRGMEILFLDTALIGIASDNNPVFTGCLEVPWKPSVNITF